MTDNPSQGRGGQFIPVEGTLKPAFSCLPLLKDHASRSQLRPCHWVSLIYSGDLLASLHTDLSAFACDRDWSAEMGIPYRWGCLLHSLPGISQRVARAFTSSLRPN